VPFCDVGARGVLLVGGLNADGLLGVLTPLILAALTAYS
jgi:hypothetical protein